MKAVFEGHEYVKVAVQGSPAKKAEEKAKPNKPKPNKEAKTEETKPVEQPVAV